MRRAPIAEPEGTAARQWWRNAVFYQVYPRSFADSNGDGVGDLEGIRSRLGYLELLGVDALWLGPVTRSPMADHGYDVADPRDIDPVFGDLAAMDALIADAHKHGLKITMDLVPNHTSDEHEWFTAALAARPGSPERARYLFRDGKGPDGEQPPNNWPSIFGGPAWTRITGPDGTPGQWYLHTFAAEQPDLDWTNLQVREDLVRTLRFWLDRGVDGFRIDVAHGMAKPAGLPDMDILESGGTENQLLRNTRDDLRFDNDGVHEIHRMIRAVLDEHPATVTIGEIWVTDDERFARYLRSDELHLGFNFRLVGAAFDAGAVREAIEHSLAAVASVGAPATWTLSNHDVGRQVTRYGGGETGHQRARAMALVELALPGAIFIYNGEELGLADVALPDAVLQDPTWERSGGTQRGRDGCRVPLPWEGSEPPFAFSSTPDTWLPMPNEWAELTVDAQLEDSGSMLSLYRQALELRAELVEAGTELEWYGAPEGCVAFRRKGGHLVCALNTSEVAVSLPPGTALISSAPLADGQLPPNAAVWLA
ncbi:MAG: glycoside hydrolase family 13 protein [Mycobacteriaceae bacterium]